MNVGERIQMLRKECGLTQRSLAEETGIPIRTIINYENSGREPNAKNMAALERYFNVSGKYLRGETDQRDVMKWDDPEIMEAVRESLPAQISGLNDVLKGCPAQEKKLTFDILVQLRYVLELKDAAKKMTALSMLHDVAAAVEHLAGKEK